MSKLHTSKKTRILESRNNRNVCALSLMDYCTAKLACGDRILLKHFPKSIGPSAESAPGCTGKVRPRSNRQLPLSLLASPCFSAAPTSHGAAFSACQLLFLHRALAGARNCFGTRARGILPYMSENNRAFVSDYDNFPVVAGHGLSSFDFVMIHTLLYAIGPSSALAHPLGTIAFL